MSERRLMGDRYFCTKCRRKHWMTSEIGKAHLEYNEEETPEEAAQPIGEETVTPPKKEGPVAP